VKARRLDRALTAAKQRNEAEARDLRTPRAPDAGPDQCPVCGGFGLADLAADDAFMERGPDRAKVVAWGRKRAHWDCAELVPYVAPPHFEPFKVDGHGIRCACKQCERTASHPGAYYRCKFCGYYRRAASLDAAKEKLIAHAKECPKRPKPTAPEPVVTGKLRASIDPRFQWRDSMADSRSPMMAEFMAATAPTRRARRLAEIDLEIQRCERDLTEAEEYLRKRP
jgi:hypothetical protein